MITLSILIGGLKKSTNYCNIYVKLHLNGPFLASSVLIKRLFESFTPVTSTEYTLSAIYTTPDPIAPTGVEPDILTGKGQIVALNPPVK
jgi:hypothetical protein